MAFNSTRYFAEFISGLADVVETGTATIVITTTGTEQIDFIYSGTATIVMTTTGIESQVGSQTVVITTSGTLEITTIVSASDTVVITASGAEDVQYFYDGTATIVMFTEGRAKVHAFNVYKDGLQNLEIT